MSDCGQCDDDGLHVLADDDLVRDHAGIVTQGLK
jgi:hypothetical protein